jgi:Ca2+-transporting ATPase
MNLVTDNIPAITLGFNPSSNDIMKEAPRNSDHILNNSLIKLLLGTGFIMGILTLSSYFVSSNIFHQSSEVSRTVALVTLILLEIVNAFNFRSFRKISINRTPFTNLYLVYASAFSILATLFIIYTGLNRVFSTVPINLKDWVLCGAVSIVAIIIFDVVKMVNNKNKVFLADTRS